MRWFQTKITKGTDKKDKKVAEAEVKTEQTEKPEETEVKANRSYERSRKYIRAAIDCLGANAKDDVLAKEAIANLSVILLDLQ